jgi:hypothetical protein
LPRTKCSNCGAPLDPGAVECSWCHGAVEPDPALLSAPATSPVPVESDSPPPPPPLPAGWIRTVDSWAGYSVGHPPQWIARCEGGVITVSPDPNGTVQAFVWPIQLRSPLHAQQVAQEFLGWAKAQNPEFEAWLIPTSEPFPRHLMMRTRSRTAGQRVEGAVTITVCGSNALISGFHAPPDSAGAAGAAGEAQTLMKVVGSFQVELPVPRQRFREPREGSFDAMAPVGWQATGRTRRSISGKVTCEYSVRKDPQGLTQVVIPGDLWRLADGPIVGLCLLGLMGMRRFVPAGKYGPDLIARQFKNQVHLHIENVTDCPHVFPRFCADLARLGLAPEAAETSVACVVSQHLVGGVPIRQKSFIATARPCGVARWTGEFSGQWIAELLAHYQAPEPDFDAVEPILAGVADSFQFNNDWVQRERAAAMQTAMIVGAMLQQQAQQQSLQIQQQMAQRRADITHTLHQTSDSIMSGWEERNRVHDHIMHQWSNATLGRTDVVDPSFGTVYSVPNDYDQYWRTNSGTFIGGSWGTQPDPSWQKLEPIKI